MSINLDLFNMLSNKEQRRKKQRDKKEETTKEEETNNVEHFKGMFSALKEQYYTDSTTKSSLQSIQESFSNADLGEVTSIFQRLNKKSDATKLKSFKSLIEILNSKDEHFFDSFLTSWSVIYEKLITSELDSRIF